MRKNRPSARTDKSLWGIALLLLAMSFLAAGCHKTCHCYAYDGSHKYFTPEDVDANGSSCSGMIYFDNIRLYSICEWDY